MSDGLSDANHAQDVAQRIESATLDLVDVIREIRDEVFGIPEDAIAEMNEILAEVGLSVTERRR